jgi:hypothetical protein
MLFASLAALLFIRLMLNWAQKPTRAALEQRDVTGYRQNVKA